MRGCLTHEFVALELLLRGGLFSRFIALLTLNFHMPDSRPAHVYDVVCSCRIQPRILETLRTRSGGTPSLFLSLFLPTCKHADIRSRVEVFDLGDDHADQLLLLGHRPLECIVAYKRRKDRDFFVWGVF